MESKSPAQRLRLKDTHSTMQKMQRLEELAQELGIRISYWGHRTNLTDKDYPGVIFDMNDIESSDHPISEFPYVFEYKLTYENPEYTKIEDEKRLFEADQRRIAELQRQEEERLREEKKVQEKHKLERDKELAELSRLQEKYKS